MEPSIVAEEHDFIVVFKPRGMHSSPLEEEERGTLLAWCAERYPEVLAPRGRKAVEGGLLHRLDKETEGLVVVARSQIFYDALAAQQEAGTFVKDYRALCVDRSSAAAAGAAESFPPLPGFPPRPRLGPPPFVVSSAFRPFGPGRKAVRPVAASADAARAGGDPRPARARRLEVALDRGEPYRTEILAMERSGDGRVECLVRLRRGFRHQIRCHLAWLGFPIIGDALYGGVESPSLRLSAVAVAFLDPVSREIRRYGCSSSTDSESTS